MQQQNNELVITILAATVMLLLTSLTIIFLVLVFRRKQVEHMRQKERLNEDFKKELLKAQLETQEQTFLSLSQELHDNIGQVLSLIKLNLTLIDKDYQGNQKEGFLQTKDLVNTAISDLRNISKTLNTDYIKTINLKDSIERELDMLRKTKRIEPYFDVQGTAFALSAERQLILFRIFQESLNNIIKHAQASEVRVLMNYTNDFLTITVRDNGCGFDKDAVNKGVGLLNMEHRAQVINSEIHIESAAGKGTIVAIKIGK